MSSQYDVIIVGAGHNGLVCANVLAKKGYKVLILEANKQVGGLAVNREFSPGFKVPACAHLVYGLHPRVIELCQLDESKLQAASSQMSTLIVNRNKEYVKIASGENVDIEYSSSLSEHECLRWSKFNELMNLYSQFLFELTDKIPPRLKNGSFQDQKTLFKTALKLRKMSKPQARNFLRIIGMNVYDLVEESFNSDLLKAGVCFESVLGSRYGPRAPNTVYNWLNRRSLMNSSQTGLSMPRGGIGSLTQKLCNHAIDKGVDVSISSRVKQILIEDNQVKGVELVNGEKYAASKVISNADIKTTMMSLVGPDKLDTDVVRRVIHIPTQGNVAKLNIALERLPESLSGNLNDFSTRVIVADSAEIIERASNAIKYNEYAEHPVFELTVPSMKDDSLVAHGKHVMSILNPYVPFQHKNGWDKQKAKFENTMLENIERIFPGTMAAMVDIETLTPLDIQQQFNVSGGHWHHCETGLERFLMLRPAPGFAQYSTPVDGLFLCGADCHPGGDLSGAPGLNAAHAIMSK